MGLTQRIADAARALTGRSAYLAATIRTIDTAGIPSYKAPTEARELVKRFVKHVKVAATMNSTGVAEVVVRPMRRTTGTSSFKARRLSKKQVKALYARADSIVRKSYVDDDDLEEITDPAHPLVRLLRAANPRDNWFDLTEQLALASEMTGNDYMLAVIGPEGWPIEAWPLGPQFTRVVPDRARFIRAYIYGTEPANEQEFDARLVTHTKFPNPLGDPYYGVGPLASVVADADLSCKFVELAHAMIDNGVNPGVVVTTESALTKDQRKEQESELNRKYAGVNKYGRSMIISGRGVKIDRFAAGEQEMKYLQSAKDVREDISNAFDIPTAFLTLDSAALATAKAAIPQWQRRAIRPRVLRRTSKMNDMGGIVQLFRDALGDDSLCLVADECVDSDEQSDAATVVSLYGGQVITLNEARGELGYDPLDGGDELKADPIQPAPFGQDQSSRDPPPTEKHWKSPSPPTPPARPPPNGGASPLVKSAVIASVLFFGAPQIHACCITKAAPDPVVTATERQMGDALNRWFRQLTGEVVANIGADGAVGVDLSSDGPLGSAFRAAVDPSISGAVQRGQGIGQNETGRGPVRYNLPETRAFLDRYEFKLTDAVMQSSEQKVRGIIADALDQGLQRPQIVEAVHQELTTASPLAAERIAVTESARALNMGRVDAWRQQGIERKTWLLSGDPCPICVAMARKYSRGGVALGESFLGVGDSLRLSDGSVFTNDYVSVDAPPVHPYCRCDVTYLETA